jgi:imidazole glycerol-phosphate synthase subunit HisH
MIVVINYGAGNVQSVLNMLRALNLKARVAENGQELDGAERIILPGVGHFDHGMAELTAREFLKPLSHMVLKEKTPLLGICLGAQLIARSSEEGTRAGLGFVHADVVAFDRSRMGPSLRVPHMGWAETWSAESAGLPKVFKQSLEPDCRFYYVHSFHLLCDDPAQAVLRTWYGYEFAAGIADGNVIGMQFHPEKSHDHGKRILRAFANWTVDTKVVAAQ